MTCSDDAMFNFFKKTFFLTYQKRLGNTAMQGLKPLSGSIFKLHPCIRRDRWCSVWAHLLHPSAVVCEEPAERNLERRSRCPSSAGRSALLTETPAASGQRESPHNHQHLHTHTHPARSHFRWKPVNDAVNWLKMNCEWLGFSMFWWDHAKDGLDLRSIFQP